MIEHIWEPNLSGIQMVLVSGVLCSGHLPVHWDSEIANNLDLDFFIA